MTVRWTPRAADDLEAIYDYIAKDKPAAASKMIQSIVQTVDLLEDNPEIGPLDNDGRTRRLVVRPYIVAYQVHAHSVQVLAVIHSARRWPGDFD